MSSEKTKVLYKPGVYDITSDEYHSCPGVSRSGLKEFRRAPYFYWYKYLNPDYVKPPQKAEFAFGSAFHTFVLEPEKFHNEYFVSEKNPHHANSNLGKEWKAKQQIEAAGKIVLDADDYMQIHNMACALALDNKSHTLIKNAEYEKSIFWHDAETGILCKCRPDILKSGYVVDLKTTTCAIPYLFEKDFFSYDYCLQIAMIHEGVKATLGYEIWDFIDLAIEKQAPYLPAIFTIDENALNYGLDMFHDLLRKFKTCLDTSNWPGYQPHKIELPSYLRS
jgi:exodeoxyribonuclease VIII